MKKKFKLLLICGLVVPPLFSSIQIASAQASVCPAYIEHFEYARKIKYCPGGGGSFITWEDCDFRAGGMCPCPMVHEQPCPGQA